MANVFLRQVMLAVNVVDEKYVLPKTVCGHPYAVNEQVAQCKAVELTDSPGKLHSSEPDPLSLYPDLATRHTLKPIVSFVQHLDEMNAVGIAWVDNHMV